MVVFPCILVSLLCLCACVGSEDACQGGKCASDADPSSFIQRRGVQDETRKPYKPKDIRGKSIYFIVVDSFASPPAAQGDAPCNQPKYGWCNGTINGITEKLDYIQGMGFEGIWITPVIGQFDGSDPDGRSGYGNYGYWAYNWYEIDEHYGTKRDLKKLSKELHKRGMVFVYDIVLNHVGPVHSTADVEKIHPFNKPEYLHQRGIGNMTFDEYARGYAYGGKGYPPPTQGLGPGAMCIAGPDGGCSNYKCPVDAGFGKPCPVVPTYWGDLDPPQEAPGPRDIPNCGVGDMVCEGYNEDQTIEGWFYSLGDLNHSHPFVSSELIKWGKFMAETYEIDGFRLDTAPYIRKEFLSDFQEAVGIPVLGEVTASNWTFFKSYAPPPGESPVLKGILNFFLQNVATPAFCGPPAFFPGANLNLSALAANIDIQFAPGQLYDPNLLGNFVDNHDMQRLAVYCNKDMARMQNAIAWTMFAQGLPMIYYGTELYFSEVHPSLWSTDYPQHTEGYLFLRALNMARKKFDATTPMEVKASGENYIVFTRGDVWVFLNNFALGSFDTVDYNIDLAAPQKGEYWVDLVKSAETGRVVKVTPNTRSAQLSPMILMLVKPDQVTSS